MVMSLTYPTGDPFSIIRTLRNYTDEASKSTKRTLFMTDLKSISGAGTNAVVPPARMTYVKHGTSWEGQQHRQVVLSTGCIVKMK